MRVTDVTYERDIDGLTIWATWTIPAESYRAGMTEREAAALATRLTDDASAPSARGIEGRSQLTDFERQSWRPRA